MGPTDLTTFFPAFRSRSRYILPFAHVHDHLVLAGLYMLVVRQNRFPFSHPIMQKARPVNRRAGTVIDDMMYWLGGKDSNLDKQIQSLPSYRWTTPQENERPKGGPLDGRTMED